MEERRLTLMGTTGIAFKIKEGIVMGIDSMARGLEGLAPDVAGGTIRSYSYNKIYEISYTIICAMAGCLPVAEEFLGIGRNEWRDSVNYTNRTVTVEQVAKFMQTGLMNSTSEFAGDVTVLLAGYTNKVANLWETSFHESMPKEIAAVGSSKEKVLQFLKDNGYGFFMDKETAAELVRRAICEAGITDTFTGGDSIKVLLVKDNGVEVLSDDSFDDLRKIYHPLYEPMEPMVEGDGEVVF